MRESIHVQGPWRPSTSSDEDGAMCAAIGRASRAARRATLVAHGARGDALLAALQARGTATEPPA